MSRSDEHRIADILSAADELSAIVNRGQAAFNTDPILRRATERLLEIVGEATNQLSSETINHYPAIPWRDISRLRIVLAHHYHRVDPDQVWVIATTHIPPPGRRTRATGELTTAITRRRYAPPQPSKQHRRHSRPCLQRA